jgi:DNA polymerase I
VTQLCQFREVWLVDFEFGAEPSERPAPRCLVAHELHTGSRLRLWHDEFGPRPPYTVGGDSLFIAYSASAELGCHRVLGWPDPVNVLDLFVEFRKRTNGLVLEQCGLLGALSYYGLPAIDAAEKESMRQLALRGGPYTAEERRALIDYCESDVVGLRRLLDVMHPVIDLPWALLRGRYMAVIANMEHRGIPVDADALRRLQGGWDAIKLALVRRFDANNLFDGVTFKVDRFERFLVSRGFSWPRHPSGHLELSMDVFKDMTRIHPELEPIRELRHSLGQLRLADLAVGRDGRCRTGLRPFASRTGRNQPSNSRFLFGMSTWLRSLIRPAAGMTLAYIDWSQQEFGIAAALSGDDNMMAAYTTGDPYLAFAIQAGAAPVGATKKTHSLVREQYKACALAVLYGMGPTSLAQRIGQSPAHAEQLLAVHRHTYPRYWRWSDAAVDHAMLHGSLTTTFGWRLRVAKNPNDRSLRNFPVQANGAEMLRLACIAAAAAGVAICAPVHDALLVEAPIDEIDAAVLATQNAMATASGLVLVGFELRSDAKVTAYPERYRDPRGSEMWSFIEASLAQPTCAPVQHGCCTSAHPSILISSSL